MHLNDFLLGVGCVPGQLAIPLVVNNSPYQPQGWEEVGSGFTQTSAELFHLLYHTTGKISKKKKGYFSSSLL